MSPEGLARIGRWFIAAAMIAFGVQHFVLGKLVTRIVPGLPAWVPGLPAWVPGQPLLVGFVGGVLLAASLVMLLDRKLLALAGGSLGVFMMFSCVMHFIYPQFVATLVPAWIPGATFWTYFSAVALFAGGLGLMLPPVRRRAALLSGLMIFSWVLVLHLPRALTAGNANEVTATFEALAFSGLALIVAGRSARREGARA